MSDERFPPHEGPSEWVLVFNRLAAGRPPSRAQLARLLKDGAIPEWATDAEREAVASILRDGPGKRAAPDPKTDDVDVEDDGYLFGYLGEFTEQEAGAYMELLHVHDELAAYETDEGPRWGGECVRLIQLESLLPLEGDSLEPESVEVRLIRVRSRGVWRVKDPKGQARRIVGERWGYEGGLSRGQVKRLRRKLLNTPWLGEVF